MQELPEKQYLRWHFGDHLVFPFFLPTNFNGEVY